MSTLYYNSSGNFQVYRNTTGSFSLQEAVEVDYTAIAKIKAGDLLGEEEEELLKQLEDLKVELS